MFNLNGRIIIYANYTEEQLLKGTIKEQGEKVLDILTNSVSYHDQNAMDCIFLKNYLYGIQDILKKKKKTRTDINHTGVENWAYAFCDWKKAFLLGKPIQYAPINDVPSDEIALLNSYVSYEHKQKLDQDLYEDVFATGHGFRYAFGSPFSDSDEAPFDLANPDVENTEVVYSSGIGHKQLLSFIKTSKIYITTTIDPMTGEKKQVERNYDEYNVYTRKRHFVVNNKMGDLEIISSQPIIINEHVITEYYINNRRMSLLEICKDIFDDINFVENLDLDDIEAFVNSIMVFTNAEIDETTMNNIVEFGALSIKSTEQKQAKVEILQSRLKSLDTQIYYLRKLSALHSILSVPQANNNGDISNAETGKAFLVGSGFTSSSVRVNVEEQAFREADRNVLKVILKVCKNTKDSGIKTLNVRDIEIKFNRDLSENLVSKTQALSNLFNINMPPEVANQVVGLFSDPVSVSKLQRQYMEEKRNIENEIKNITNNSVKSNQEQNNEMNTAKSFDEQ